MKPTQGISMTSETRIVKPVLFIFAILLCLAAGKAAYAEQFSSIGTTDVYFSPHGGATEAIVRELKSARKTVSVQAFSFTNKRIAKALVEAWKRGIKVEVIFDGSQQKDRYTSARFIARAGIPALIDAEHAIAHNKVMIIDDETIITGSFNFTQAAEKDNAENLLIIKGNAPLAARYQKNYTEHRTHSAPYR